MSQQLSFDLPARPALGRDDFFVSSANSMAVAMIEGWRNWSGRKLALIGPAGSGKTHLAHVWAIDSHATILSTADLPDADIPALARGPVCVEDIPLIAGNDDAERALFHLHNLVLAEGHSLLVTANTPAKDWDISLPDLASRMQGTQSVMMDSPDDMLLTVLLAKLFNDRQLVPAPDAIPFLIKNMPRSFDMAAQVVQTMDRIALAERRPITRPLARKALIELGLSPVTKE